MKHCPKCDQDKKLVDFYHNKRNKYSYCKKCTKDYVSIWRKKNKDKIRIYTQTALLTGSRLTAVYVHRAVKCGRLDDLKKIDKKCSFCKTNKATMYDHRDYNKPLEVNPVCASCNRKLSGVKHRVKGLRLIYARDRFWSRCVFSNYRDSKLPIKEV